MEEVIEIFGKRVKIVQDESDSCNYCDKCALEQICYDILPADETFCKDAEGDENRHFEETSTLEENEKIRMKFIEALEECGFTHFPNDFTINEAITWLEKNKVNL